MDHKAKIIQRLKNPEDAYVERKTASAKGLEIRKTIVGFANSVPEDINGILFLGISNDGKPLGISHPDSLQKTIRNICKKECYPPIQYQSEIIQVDGKDVLAVIIPESQNKPHFSGPSFVRVGSETEIASEEMFNELVLNRIDKCRNIIRHKGIICTVESIGRRLLSRRAVGSGHAESTECRIEDCTAHYVTLKHINTGSIFSVDINDISISKDHNKSRLKLIIK